MLVTFVTILVLTVRASAEATGSIGSKNEPEPANPLMEIWQEDNHEVRVRKGRGAKDASGGSGKKKDRNSFGTTRTPKLNQNQKEIAKPKMDLSSQISPTEQTNVVGKHQNQNEHQSKHRKTHLHPKKHTNTSTIKPSSKPESKFSFSFHHCYNFTYLLHH